MVKYNFKIYKVQNSSKLGITYGIVQNNDKIRYLNTTSDYYS